MTLFDIVAGMFVAMLSGMVSVLWRKVERAEKSGENNRIIVEYLSKQIDKTNDLTQRLTSLEASVNVEIKNLSVSIKRMESAILRIDQNARNKNL